MTVSYYDEHSLSAAFFDLVTTAYPIAGDEAFYAGLAGPAPSTVLELGCGTGRIAIALAERGHAVVGVDLAPAMLHRAALKCGRLPPEVAAHITLLQGDMTSLDLRRRFGSVLVPFYGFSHLPDPAARHRALGVVARHLAPGGRAAIHVPPLAQLTTPLGDEELSGPYNDRGDRVRIRIVERDFDPASGRFRQAIDYVLLDPDGRETRRSREELVYFGFEDAELEASAGTVGLAVERILGDFSGASDGPHRIYVLAPA